MLVIWKLSSFARIPNSVFQFAICASYTRRYVLIRFCLPPELGENAKILLQAGAAVDTLDKEKNVALHYAAAFERKECVALLLQHGASVIRKKTTSPHKSIQMTDVPKGLADKLPDDIIKEELLIRLPVKTLMKFKCVSKYWNDFISDDYFRRRYQSRQLSMGNKPTGFFCGSTGFDYFAYCCGYCVANKFLYTSKNHVENEELESFFNCSKHFGYLIAASKGLLLLGYHPKKLYVYDLVSKKHVSLPRNTLPTFDEISLGFKCEESSSTNPHHCSYKVVCVDILSRCVYKTVGSSFKVDIYSSETGTWQSSTLKSRLPILMNSFDVSKVIGGVFHWHQRYLDLIVAYDLNDSKGRTVQIEPPSVNDPKPYGKILRQIEGRQDGSLQFISIKDLEIRVWTMQRNASEQGSYTGKYLVPKSKWSLASSVSLSDIGVGVGDISFLQQNCPRIICADPVDPQIIYLNIADQVYAYDCRKGKVGFTLSQKIKLKTDVFVHFEWPTWPCF